MDCPDEERILGFIEGGLDPEAAEAIHAHLGTCDDCIRLAAEAMKHGPGAAASVEPEAPWPESGGMIGRYVVQSVLGAGNMGLVYSAHDPELRRQVALKLLRPQQAGAGDGRSLLLEEARAMARLSHPNVVAVYDVGSHGEQIFVAMELVAGSTLREWRSKARRSWQEVARVFVQAGRGLAAAHAAGLVHRDFKPENVLIGDDGSVRVTDFGLARLEQGAVLRAEAQVPAAAALPAGISARAASLRTGLWGSPAYMAPEQLEGRQADARSDLFSFCVALYESLCGERPLTGATVDELRADARSGRARELPRSVAVPAWLRGILARGLQRDPADRFPSMDALLGELREGLEGLERAPEVRRRRWTMGLAGALALGAVAAAFLLRPEAALACRDRASRTAALWDEARQQRAKAAFLATHLAYADDAFTRVSAALERFREAWTGQYAAACEASAAGKRDDGLAYLRMACLTQQLAGAQAKSDLFAQADDKVVEVAAMLAAALEDPASCATWAGRSAPPPPEGWQRAAVERVHGQLARARSLSEAGRYSDALPLAKAALESADQTGWPPLRAEALLALAQTQGEMDDVASYQTAKEAALKAEATHHDGVAAKAWLLALHLCVLELSDVAKLRACAHTRDLLEHARAAVDRLGPDDLYTAYLGDSEGILLWREGKPQDGEVVLRRALALYDKSGREDQFKTWLLNDEAVALNLVGRDEESAELFRRAAAMKERLLGPRHPDFGMTLSNLGSTLTALGRYEEAQRTLDQAAAVLRATLGPDHVWNTGLDVNLGDLAFARKDYPRARDWYRRTVERTRGTARATHSFTVLATVGLGRSLVELGQPAEAVQVLEPALAGAGPSEPLDRAAVQFALARARVAAGRDASAAAALARQARALFAAAGQGSAASVAEIDEWLQAQAPQQRAAARR